MIKMICVLMIAAFTAACSYQEPVRIWQEVQYPHQMVAVEIVNSAGMNKEEMDEVRQALDRALAERNIAIDQSAALKLRLEVVKHRTHPLPLWIYQWGVEIMGGVTVAHWSLNGLRVRAQITLPNGQSTEVVKFGEIRESGRNFGYLCQSTMRRVADAVFHADAAVLMTEAPAKAIAVTSQSMP